jgi:hypothetical protein
VRVHVRRVAKAPLELLGARQQAQRAALAHDAIGAGHTAGEELAGEEPAGEEEDEDINWDEVDWV